MKINWNSKLLQMSLTEFDLMIFKLSTKTLFNYMQQINSFKKEISGRANEKEHLNYILDLERKYSKIEQELMRRGYIKMNDLNERSDYTRWQKDQFKIKRYF